MSAIPSGVPAADAVGPALVLIAEDEEPLAETVAFAVREAGYTPLVALHGRQALELARDRRPALLILDLMLPYLDGAAIVAALRTDAQKAGTATPPVRCRPGRPVPMSSCASRFISRISSACCIGSWPRLPRSRTPDHARPMTSGVPPRPDEMYGYTKATTGSACLRTSLGPRVSTLAPSAGQIDTVEPAGPTVASF
jgi:CheY-like chemotaxis protein